MNELGELRQRLSNITKEISSLTALREGIISHIQSLKKINDQSSWDPEQELKMFQNLLDPQVTMSAQELLHLSLLIEMQSIRYSDYPRWSESVHLVENEVQNRIYSQINPVLVFLSDREKFYGLKFKSEYDQVLKGFLKNVE